jgi:hypothetical protein
MTADTAPAEYSRRRGERTDSAIKKLPDDKGWRARATLGTDPVTGTQVRPTKVFATKKGPSARLTNSASSGASTRGRRSPRAPSTRRLITG